jgi:2'-5' RNA ligase
VIFPEGDLVQIEQFRQTWDPLCRSVSAHITLVFPVEQPVPEEELAAAFEDLFSTSPPFTVTASTVRPWQNEYLFLVVEQGAERVRLLHETLYGGPFSAVPRPVTFLPHMTLGRVDASRLQSAVAEAEEQRLSLTADVTTLSVYRIHDDGRRTETLRYRLPSHPQPGSVSIPDVTA